ncbi:uncharacterized protein LOC122020074 isoform X1 [Zingiber officinale]|uniref:uncharacterized protein LOC122020074 isoform X1 n=1 Tax=Zingiber officinale TaxID=94328 RepID=UPI001C4D14CC|nr:uncharacterized protein LOC122020074 isoform X1 [Zingiber officinale]
MAAARGIALDTEGSGRKRKRYDPGGGSLPEAKRKRSYDEEAAAAAEVGKRERLSKDPLEVLGMDMMMRILELSDACSVARCSVVSRGWHEIAVSDHLWGPKYQKLLKEKAHIPLLSNLHRASRFAAYSMCVMDGKRTRITKEDLYDHVWEFRFKKAAPEYWRDLDPSWKCSGPPMHRYFNPDGSHTADFGDKVWGGHECTYSIITSYVGKGQIRDHYVRINRWPPLTVSRKKDWSWEMQNHLYRYNSVPNAEKDGGTGPPFPAW